MLLKTTQMVCSWKRSDSFATQQLIQQRYNSENIEEKAYIMQMFQSAEQRISGNRRKRAPQLSLKEVNWRRLFSYLLPDWRMALAILAVI